MKRRKIRDIKYEISDLKDETGNNIEYFNSLLRNFCCHHDSCVMTRQKPYWSWGRERMMPRIYCNNDAAAGASPTGNIRAARLTNVMMMPIMVFNFDNFSWFSLKNLAISVLINSFNICKHRSKNVDPPIIWLVSTICMACWWVSVCLSSKALSFRCSNPEQNCLMRFE